MDSVLCEISMAPDSRLVSSVAKFTAEVTTRVLGDRELGERLFVAAHELFDNAVKYGIDGQSTLAVRVTRGGGHLRVGIHTKNRIADGCDAEIRALFEEMEATPDRDAFYQKLLRRTARRTEGSGLGLGRIHSEIKMDLRYEIDGDILHLVAEACVSENGENA